MNVARTSEPGATEGPSRKDLLRRIYEQTKTIAVVGASANENKAAHLIPKYLQSQGYRIIPVNPKGGEILGERVYPSLEEEIDARSTSSTYSVLRQRPRPSLERRLGSALKSSGSSPGRTPKKPSNSPPMRGLV